MLTRTWWRFRTSYLIFRGALSGRRVRGPVRAAIMAVVAVIGWGGDDPRYLRKRHLSLRRS